MGLFDIFKKDKVQSNNKKSKVKWEYADSSSIAPDEREYYQSDEYYSYTPYPSMVQKGSEKTVITFDERKKISIPSERGLYVGEIMLLEYCSYGTYPKPRGGYPGLWWFEFGIRDVGHALESLEKRGFIQWNSALDNLQQFKVAELKELANELGISVSGKKANIIKQLQENASDSDIPKKFADRKYGLTDLGRIELEENGYVPYMYRHSRKTVERSPSSDAFNVWSINRLLKGKTRNWREIVGGIEEKQFGINLANRVISDEDKNISTEKMREYLKSIKNKVLLMSVKADPLQEELNAIDLKAMGDDKEALLHFYVAIQKRFDAPALYREAAILLRKYKLYQEELYVLEQGLRNIPKNNGHLREIEERKEKLEMEVKTAL